MQRRPPYARPRVSRAERAFLSAAFDPAPDAAARWGARYGAEAEKPKRAAPTGAKSASRRGTAAEGTWGGRGVSALLKAEGYTVVRSHLSQGAADVIGLRARLDVAGPPVRAVQAKRRRTFVASDLNEAIARFLGLDHWHGFSVADGTRECWLYVDGAGWVARAALDAAGALTVTGTRAADVERSLRTMLARGGRQRARPDKPSLAARLGVEE